MAMGGLMRLKLKSVAADLAMQDGRDWSSLDPQEQENYFSKAHHQQQDKKTTRPPTRAR